MTRPDDGATAPDTGTTEPGHRARAYAAALLGELTGGRRSGFGAALERDPQDPASVPDLAASTLVERPDSAAADDAPQREEADGQDRADGTGAPATGDAGTAAGPHGDAVGAPLAEPADARSGADPVSLAGDEAPRPQSSVEPLVGDSATLDDPEGASLAGGSPAVDGPAAGGTGVFPGDAGDAASGTAATGTADDPAVATRVGAGSPLVGTPVRTDAVLERATPAGQAARSPRPAPFTYAEVAAHHTGPARSRAHGALDAAGPAISARSDREQVRRAARTAVAAAALLDACDGLDERARAVDTTWDGERHGTTEVQEFERAWSGFYDTSAALTA